MTILPNSPLQNSGNYFLNSDNFESKLFFTDSNTQLYFIISRYDYIEEKWKVIYNGKLRGYSMNSTYNYRIDLTKYIDVIQHIEPTFTNLDNNYNQQFKNNNYSQIGINVSQYDILNYYSSEFTIDSNGEVWLVDAPDDLTAWAKTYNFYNKEDSNSINVGIGNTLYVESFIPSTVYNFTSPITKDFIGKNLLNNSRSPEWQHNTTYTNMTSVLMSDETELYRRNIPIAGQRVTCFNAGNGQFTFDDPDCTYYAGIDIRVQGTTGEFGTVSMYIHTDYDDSVLVTYNVPFNVWTRIYTEGFTVPIINSTDNKGYIIFNNDSTVNLDKYLDVKNVKIEKNAKTVWTPSVGDFDLSVMCFDSNNYVLNKLNKEVDSDIYDYLTYIPEGTTKLYCHSNDRCGFFNVLPNKCNLHNWYYYNNNGNLTLSYTDANVHEVENTQKEYLTIGNKEYTTKLITTKQKKINTGYGLTDTEMYELVKTPYVYDSINPDIQYSGLNLLRNTSDFPNLDYWFTAGENPYGVATRSTVNGILQIEFIREEGTGFLYLGQDLFLKPLTTYTISFMYRNNAVSSFYCYNAGITNIKYSDIDISNSYKEFSFSFTTDNSLLGKSIRIDCNGGGVTSSFLYVYNIKLEEGSVATPYSKSPLDTDSTFGTQTFKRYKQLNSTFEGFNGSLLNEKNVEMVIEDEKKYEKKSNIKLNFFD
jgi:hypothetical protein